MQVTIEATFNHITIEIIELEEYDSLRWNHEGDDFNYKWSHTEGLGFLTPNRGCGITIEDCIKQAKKAYGLKS